MAKFSSEREGQIDFFNKLEISTDIELTHNTDGVYKGTLFEFKLTISDINKVLLQAIKYLSHKRIKGEPVPSQILLVALNEKIAYLFNSDVFLKEIETIYAGAASKDNLNFSTKVKPEKIDFNNIKGLSRIIEILDNESYTKINIDVFCVVGWAEHYYRLNPKASKSKLFEELRKPKQFEKYIYSWKGKDIDFKYINDLLNAKTLKKELGAFYTPAPYCRKATELVRRAIKNIPKDNDYIILDRSAGTGNLEEFLTDKNVKDITIGELDKYLEKDFVEKYLQDKSKVIKVFYSDKILDSITIGELEKQKTKINMYDYLSDNELSHTIVNTYELKEWIVLNERLGNKVKLIIPPNVDPKDQLVNGGDSLSEHFVLGSKVGRMFISKEYLSIIDELNNYVNSKTTNLILLENPPYRDSNSSHYNESIKQEKNISFIKSQMMNEKLGDEARDISNQFIWSAWKFYLKKPDDYYVLFSPIKYWKSLGLSNKKFIDGFLFNRKYFHATESAISCILWKNLDENIQELNLKAFNINNKNTIDQDDDEIVFHDNLLIRKANSTLESFADNRKFDNDEKTKCWSNADGNEKIGKNEGQPLYNKNIIGWLRAKGYSCDPMNTQLVRQMIYINRGFYLRNDNFIDKLPLFAAKLYPQKNWYEKDIYFTTADGGNKYLKDKNFLKSCFIFTCLSQKNHCRSFDGSDGRFYKNELCFDKGTLASIKLKDYKLTKVEEDLIDTFNDILAKAKKTEKYNKKFTYGIYQIDDELNTRYKVGEDSKEWIYNYPELNTNINTLKNKLAKYYEEVIQPKLFEYELLK